MWFLKSGHRHIRHIRAETLNEYLDGRLHGNDLAKVERRLEACDSCRVELEELRATITAVQQLPMEQPRRSFVMAAPPPEPIRARQPFALRAPTWAYASAASIAVVVLAALISVDATGGLSPGADSPEAVVATAQQSRSAAPETAATAVAAPQAAAARAPDPEPPADAQAGEATAMTSQESQEAKGDGEAAAESGFRQDPPEADDTEGPTVAAVAVEEPGTLSAAAENAAEALPEPVQAPSPDVASVPTAEADESPGGTSVWWRVLEGLAAAAALAFVVVLALARRSSRN